MDKFKKLAIIQSSLLFFLLIILISTLKIASFNEKPTGHKGVIITDSVFDFLPNNEKVLKYSLKNAQDFEIELLTYGATLKSGNCTCIRTFYLKKILNLFLNTKPNKPLSLTNINTS
jgi:hypothetical protein